MIPLIINTPETMLKIRVVTAKDSSAKTLECLQETGVLHIEEPRELDPTDRTAIEEKRNLIRTISANINDILSYVKGEHTILIPESAEAQPLDKILHQTGRLRDRCTRLREDATRLEADISNMEGLGRYLDILAHEINLSLKDDYFFWYIGSGDDKKADIAKRKDTSYLWIFDEDYVNSFNLKSYDKHLDIKLLQVYCYK